MQQWYATKHAKLTFAISESSGNLEMHPIFCLYLLKCVIKNLRITKWTFNMMKKNNICSQYCGLEVTGGSLMVAKVSLYQFNLQDNNIVIVVK